MHSVRKTIDRQGNSVLSHPDSIFSRPHSKTSVPDSVHSLRDAKPRDVSAVVERGWILVRKPSRRWPFEVETGRPMVVSERVVVSAGPSQHALPPDQVLLPQGPVLNHPLHLLVRDGTLLLSPLCVVPHARSLDSSVAEGWEGRTANACARSVAWVRCGAASGAGVQVTVGVPICVTAVRVRTRNTCSIGGPPSRARLHREDQQETGRGQSKDFDPFHHVLQTVLLRTRSSGRP
jgi:hypothetical protein